MTIINDQDLQPTVAAELSALAELLASLPEERWDEPSLCDGWRVREVVAHMTMAARYSPAAFEAELRASAFDFDALSNRVAARDGDAPPDALLSDLRSETLAQWAPPGGGYAGALNHVVVHGLDITVPLGLSRSATDSTIRTVLDGLTHGGMHEHFGIALGGIELRATDLDWSFGSGRAVTGTAEDLVLALSGRDVASVTLQR